MLKITKLATTNNYSCHKLLIFPMAFSQKNSEKGDNMPVLHALNNRKFTDVTFSTTVYDKNRINL